MVMFAFFSLAPPSCEEQEISKVQNKNVCLYFGIEEATFLSGLLSYTMTFSFTRFTRSTVLFKK